MFPSPANAALRWMSHQLFDLGSVSPTLEHTHPPPAAQKAPFDESGKDNATYLTVDSPQPTAAVSALS